MNVPKLRFKEFNDEWCKEYAGNLCSIQTGKSNTQDKTDDGIYPFYVRSPIIEKSHKFIFDTEAVLTVGDGVGVGKVFHYINGKFDCHQRVYMMNNFNKITAKYFYYIFSRDFDKRVMKMTAKTSVDSVRYEMIDKMQIFYPTVLEQNKISRTLELLDKKIELQTKKIEDLKLFKLYTKNQIFKDYDEIFKLKDILVKWNKKNKNSSVKYVESISNKYGFISQSDQFEDRNVASKDLSNYYIIEKGVFGYNPSRLNVGSLALKTNDKVSVVSPLYECFTTSQNNQYLLEWFDSKYFRKETISKFEGGVRNTLNFSNLCEIKIGLPTIEKQNKYSRIFKIFNNKIEFEVKKLYKLQELKKGLMQSMFV